MLEVKNKCIATMEELRAFNQYLENISPSTADTEKEAPAKRIIDLELANKLLKKSSLVR